MPNPNARVGRVQRLDPPADRAARERAVILADDTQARLDPDDPKAEGMARILEGAARLRRPVYIEIDPATDYVRRLLLPDVSRVAKARTLSDGSLDVLLEMSHAIRTLKKGGPDFESFSTRLKEAERDRKTPLIVTFENDGAIIDVRAFRPGPDGDPPPFPPPSGPVLPFPWLKRFIKEILAWPLWPWRWGSWFGCISQTRAQEVFDSMAATTCSPLTVAAPCIPFLYPDDGCWARAHEMVRLMLNMGLNPKKVWILGWPLNPSTKNHPNCAVRWGWHVAPTLCVRTNTVFLRTQMVIDPALFTTPVTKAAWKAIQNNPSATLTTTDGSYYHWIVGDPDDPGYTKTNGWLDHYRLELQNRALMDGPPPYAHCP